MSVAPLLLPAKLEVPMLTDPKFSLPLHPLQSGLPLPHLTFALVRVASDLHVGVCGQFSGLTVSFLS